MSKKRPSEFKQMTFDTAIRNPERYKNILSILIVYENVSLTNDILLEIVCKLYLVGEVKSKEIIIQDNTTIDDIKEAVKEVNLSRNADGGFPKGYPSRFWTYVRTLCELNLVYARYQENLLVSDIARLLVNNDLDDQEVFSIQAMRYNRKSPYRNVSNDYNYFKFILNVLRKLKNEHRRLSYNEFIISLFNKYGDVDLYIKKIKQNNFNEFDDIKLQQYINDNFGVKNKIKTMLKDYPDVVIRLLRITGFITVMYKGKIYIELDESRMEYINEIESVAFEFSLEEKDDALLYYKKANSYNSIYLNIVKKYKGCDEINGDEYRNKLLNIINENNLTEKLIVDLLNNDEELPAFKYIPAPLKLEFYISLLLYIKYRNTFAIKPNYKVDSLGMPISHAPGNMGDIELFNKTVYWLIEVTLMRSKAQQMNFETTTTIRHLITHPDFITKERKYLSFIAPLIHFDTREFYEFGLRKYRKECSSLYIKPYTIEEFILVALNSDHVKDMESYSEELLAR